jgi:hypothetical protein
VTDAENSTAFKDWNVEIKDGEPISVGWQPGTYSTKAFLPFTIPGLPAGGTATFTSASRKPDGSAGNAAIECKEWATAQYGCTVKGTTGSLTVDIFVTTTETVNGSPVNAYATIRRQMNFTMSGPTQVSMGRDYGCARYENTTIRCWGDNSVGQLGHTFAVATPSSPEPVTVIDANGSAITGFTEVWANANSEPGKQFTCGRRAFRATPAATTDTIEYLCWGYGLEGQLGNGLLQSSTVPVRAVIPLGTSELHGGGRDIGMVLGGATACVGMRQLAPQPWTGWITQYWLAYPYCWGNGSTTASVPMVSNYGGAMIPLQFWSSVNSTYPTRRLQTDMTLNTDGICYYETYAGRDTYIRCQQAGSYGQENYGGPYGRLAAGRHHVCLTKVYREYTFVDVPTGTGFCWGDDSQQQGAGSSPNPSAPSSNTYIAGSFHPGGLSAGGDTTCGRWRQLVTVEYQLKCWGRPFAGTTSGTLVSIANDPSYAGGYPTNDPMSVGHTAVCFSNTASGNYPFEVYVPSLCFGSTTSGQTAIGPTPLVGGMTTAYPANY